MADIKFKLPAANQEAADVSHCQQASDSWKSDYALAIAQPK